MSVEQTQLRRHCDAVEHAQLTVRRFMHPQTMRSFKRFRDRLQEMRRFREDVNKPGTPATPATPAFTRHSQCTSFYIEQKTKAFEAHSKACTRFYYFVTFPFTTSEFWPGTQEHPAYPAGLLAQKLPFGPELQASQAYLCLRTMF